MPRPTELNDAIGPDPGGEITLRGRGDDPVGGRDDHHRRRLDLADPSP